ncbi:MAG: NifB/NifX family molybdenum-iron cluster-binding protein [Proteobacteria bacterium]|nr:NifB/NifX family molybdenum-iron cluster-binding protein [Pseudomonadota bacterium]
MRIAIPHWQGRVSPVFDVARDLLLVDIEKAAELHRESRTLISQNPLRRAREVADLGTDLLICGAISMVMETALLGAGIQVIGFVCGDIEEIRQAFMAGDLAGPRFLMPGICAKRRRVRSRSGTQGR